MVTIKRSVWTFLFIAATLSALGCASSGVSRALGPNDLPSLAGKWAGSMRLPSGQNTYGTMEMSPNGDYVVQASGFSAQGKAQVKDGNLLLVPSATSGGGGAVTGPRSSVASLSERQDGGLVLTGIGHSAMGPFSFEVSRPK